MDRGKRVIFFSGMEHPAVRTHYLSSGLPINRACISVDKNQRVFVSEEKKSVVLLDASGRVRTVDLDGIAADHIRSATITPCGTTLYARVAFGGIWAYPYTLDGQLVCQGWCSTRPVHYVPCTCPLKVKAHCTCSECKVHQQLMSLVWALTVSTAPLTFLACMHPC